jgi:hypothetical protein
VARDIYGIIFKFLGSYSKMVDCGLILDKYRWFFANVAGIIGFGNIFELKNLRTRSTNHGPPNPRSTMDQPPLLAVELTRARPTAAPELPADGQGMGEGKWAREPDG